VQAAGARYTSPIAATTTAPSAAVVSITAGQPAAPASGAWIASASAMPRGKLPKSVPSAKPTSRPANQSVSIFTAMMFMTMPPSPARTRPAASTA